MNRDTSTREITPIQCFNVFQRREQRNKLHALKAASKPVPTITARDVHYVKDEISEALDALEDLQKRGSLRNQSVEALWSKSDLANMRKLYGKNFHAAEKATRKLLQIDLELELAMLQQKYLEARIDALTEQEKALVQKLQALYARH